MTFPGTNPNSRPTWLFQLIAATAALALAALVFAAHSSASTKSASKKAHYVKAAVKGSGGNKPAVNVQQAAGTSAAAIQAAVDAYRADLGALNPNPNPAVSFPSGRREINWDAVPDALSSPNAIPADFFNVNSPRGVVFDTPGSGFQVSGKAPAPIEFDNINPTYSSLFATFSPPRLFTALDSTVTNVRFFVPGSSTPATTSGFGSVFTSVGRPGQTRVTYYDEHNRRMGRFDVPASPGNGSLSFLGVRFLDDEVARVKIRSGNTALGPNEKRGRDVVAMDDFIYGEPTP
jgi:hypothetical protein